MAALYMALDMGLSSVLVQFAAREFIGFSWAWLRYALPGLPRFVTIRRDSKKIIAYNSTIGRAQIFYLCLVLPGNLNF